MTRPDPRECFGCGRTFTPIADTNGLCGPCRGERRDGFVAARKALVQAIPGDPQPQSEAA